MRIRVRVRGRWYEVEVQDPGRYPFEILVDGEPLEVEVEPQAASGGGPSSPPGSAPAPPGLHGVIPGEEKIVHSPMPGRVVGVSVRVWDEVATGAEVCVLETMKMEQSVRVSHEGTVRAVFIQLGQHVSAGDPLIQME